MHKRSEKEQKSKPHRCAAQHHLVFFLTLFFFFFLFYSRHIANTSSAGDDALTFSKSTHDQAANANRGASTVYDYALSASTTISNAAGSAGAGIMKGISSINESLPESIKSKDEGKSSSTDMSDMRRALNEATSGVAEG